MSHRASLALHFDTAEQAARLAASLAPDDDGFVKVRVEGATIVAEATSDTPLGLLRTLDEVLATLTAAQKADRIGA